MRKLVLAKFLLAFSLGTIALPAIALDPAAIQTRAAKFVVKIGGDRGGTGFFIRKSNNRYTILTNRHVVENPTDRIVTTSDGKLYNFSNVRAFPGLDLAEIEIESEVNYPVATLSNKSTISPGSLVYTYGWNAVGTRLKSRGLQWLDGKITGQLPTYNSSDGYSLAYTLTLIHGLSGSPLMNEDGEVIGIYGSGEENSIGLGIPIASYQMASNNYGSSKKIVVSRPPSTMITLIASPRAYKTSTDRVVVTGLTAKQKYPIRGEMSNRTETYAKAETFAI
jgi:S1-C subfamily serine protease